MATSPKETAPGWQLTPEQHEKVVEHLRRTWGQTRFCPFHPERRNQWEVGNIVTGTIKFDGKNISLGAGPTYPLITVTCTVCGFTAHINAIKAGVIEADRPPEARET